MGNAFALAKVAPSPQRASAGGPPTMSPRRPSGLVMEETSSFAGGEPSGPGPHAAADPSLMAPLDNDDKGSFGAHTTRVERSHKAMIDSFRHGWMDVNERLNDAIVQLVDMRAQVGEIVTLMEHSVTFRSLRPTEVVTTQAPRRALLTVLQVALDELSLLLRNHELLSERYKDHAVFQVVPQSLWASLQAMQSWILRQLDVFRVEPASTYGLSTESLTSILSQHSSVITRFVMDPTELEIDTSDPNFTTRGVRNWTYCRKAMMQLSMPYYVDQLEDSEIPEESESATQLREGVRSLQQRFETVLHLVNKAQLLAWTNIRFLKYDLESLTQYSRDAKDEGTEKRFAELSRSIAACCSLLRSCEDLIGNWTSVKELKSIIAYWDLVKSSLSNLEPREEVDDMMHSVLVPGLSLLASDMSKLFSCVRLYNKWLFLMDEQKGYEVMMNLLLDMDLPDLALSIQGPSPTASSQLFSVVLDSLYNIIQDVPTLYGPIVHILEDDRAPSPRYFATRVIEVESDINRICTFLDLMCVKFHAEFTNVRFVLELGTVGEYDKWEHAREVEAESQRLHQAEIKRQASVASRAQRQYGGPAARHRGGESIDEEEEEDEETPSSEAIVHTPGEPLHVIDRRHQTISHTMKSHHKPPSATETRKRTVSEPVASSSAPASERPPPTTPKDASDMKIERMFAIQQILSKKPTPSPSKSASPSTSSAPAKPKPTPTKSATQPHATPSTPSPKKLRKKEEKKLKQAEKERKKVEKKERKAQKLTQSPAHTPTPTDQVKMELTMSEDELSTKQHQKAMKAPVTQAEKRQELNPDLPSSSTTVDELLGTLDRICSEPPRTVPPGVAWEDWALERHEEDVIADRERFSEDRPLRLLHETRQRYLAEHLAHHPKEYHEDELEESPSELEPKSGEASGGEVSRRRLTGTRGKRTFTSSMIQTESDIEELAQAMCIDQVLDPIAASDLVARLKMVHFQRGALPRPNNLSGILLYQRGQIEREKASKEKLQTTTSVPAQVSSTLPQPKPLSPLHAKAPRPPSGAQELSEGSEKRTLSTHQGEGIMAPLKFDSPHHAVSPGPPPPSPASFVESSPIGASLRPISSPTHTGAPHLPSPQHLAQSPTDVFPYDIFAPSKKRQESTGDAVSEVTLHQEQQRRRRRKAQLSSSIPPTIIVPSDESAEVIDEEFVLGEGKAVHSDEDWHLEAGETSPQEEAELEHPAVHRPIPISKVASMPPTAPTPEKHKKKQWGPLRYVTESFQGLRKSKLPPDLSSSTPLTTSDASQPTSSAHPSTLKSKPATPSGKSKGQIPSSSSPLAQIQSSSITAMPRATPPPLPSDDKAKHSWKTEHVSKKEASSGAKDSAHTTASGGPPASPSAPPQALRPTQSETLPSVAPITISTGPSTASTVGQPAKTIVSPSTGIATPSQRRTIPMTHEQLVHEMRYRPLPPEFEEEPEEAITDDEGVMPAMPLKLPLYYSASSPESSSGSVVSSTGSQADPKSPTHSPSAVSSSSVKAQPPHPLSPRTLESQHSVSPPRPARSVSTQEKRASEKQASKPAQIPASNIPTHIQSALSTPSSASPKHGGTLSTPTGPKHSTEPPLHSHAQLAQPPHALSPPQPVHTMPQSSTLATVPTHSLSPHLMKSASQPAAHVSSAKHTGATLSESVETQSSSEAIAAHESTESTKDEPSQDVAAPSGSVSDVPPSPAAAQRTSQKKEGVIKKFTKRMRAFMSGSED